MRVGSFYIMICLILLGACKHDPIEPAGNGQMQDMDPGPIEPPPPPPPVEDDCDSSLVYFENDIAPIFMTSCGSGNVNCHQEASDNNDDVDLSSWWAILNSENSNLVDLDDPSSSDIIDEINDGNMPPPGSIYSISDEQVSILLTWIEQGATNDSCQSTGCDTVNVSFAMEIDPIISNFCASCHSGSTPSAGLLLSDYDEIVSAVINTPFLEAIKGEGGVTPMPYQGDQLNACYISKIEKWIEDGMPNN